MNRSLGLVLALTTATLVACSTKPQHTVDGYPDRTLNPWEIVDAVPRHEPRSKYGNPSAYNVLGQRYTTLQSGKGFVERGYASFYGTKFHGRRTSSGETYDMYEMTAAHKSLPLPTYVQVINLDNGRTTVVKVNDRGPFHEGRIIDLSYAAAVKLGLDRRGVGKVEIRAIDPDNPTAHLNKTSRSDVAALPDARLFVQAGAFSRLENAQRRRAKLQDRALKNVRIHEDQRQGGKLFKVYVGPLESVAQADALSADLRDQGIADAHTVTD